MKIEENNLHNSEMAQEFAPKIEAKVQKYELFKTTKRIATRGSLALLGTGMAIGLLNSGEGSIEPIDFENTEQVDVTEHSENIIEAPDGTQYQGFWLDGETGSSWADLGLTRQQRQQVLQLNQLDAVPNEPTTIFVPVDILEK